MRKTSRICPKQGFNCIAGIKVLFLVAKKNTETVKCFLCTFYHGPRFTFTSLMQQHYFKKIFEGVWDSNFEQSEQVKFAKFLSSAPNMVAPRGSLNSWNQWINDPLLYESLFRPLLFWFNVYFFTIFVSHIFLDKLGLKNLKFSELTEILYWITLLLAYYNFNVCFFKLLSHNFGQIWSQNQMFYKLTEI